MLGVLTLVLILTFILQFQLIGTWREAGGRSCFKSIPHLAIPQNFGKVPLPARWKIHCRISWLWRYWLWLCWPHLCKATFTLLLFYVLLSNFLRFIKVRCSSGEMQRIVHKEATAFSECLRSQERETQGQARSGHISLTFYQTKKARWPFPSENIPWEVWNLRMEIMTLASEIGIQCSANLPSICKSVD
jgi:hypothetical protein